MNYKAIVKSPMEIIGMDVKEFMWEVETTTYNYTREKYELRGQEIIINDGIGKYDYYGVDGRGWLKSWLKDIRPVEKGWRAFKRGEIPIGYVNYLYKYKSTGRVEKAIGYDNCSKAIAQLMFHNGWINNQIMFDTREVSKDNGKTWEPVGVKEYFDGDVYLDKTVDGKYADYEILKLWNAFKEGYEQKEREIKHEIQ